MMAIQISGNETITVSRTRNLYIMFSLVDEITEFKKNQIKYKFTCNLILFSRANIFND